MKTILKVLLLIVLISLTIPIHAQDFLKIVFNSQVFENTNGFSNGLAAVKKGEKWGYLDQTFSTVIDYKYNDAGDFASNGLASVKKENLWGYIDQTGKEVIDYQFNKAGVFTSNGLASVRKGDVWGYIDQTGKVVIDCHYDIAEDFASNGLARVRMGVKWGYIDQTGRTIISCKFDDARNFISNSLIKVQKNNLWGFADKEGKVVIDFQFTDVGIFTANGLAAVKRIDKWGYIDQTGKVVIDYQFKEARGFSLNGIARVRKGTDWYYINQDGDDALNLRFNEFGNFVSSGLALVNKGGNWGIINQSGKSVIEYQCEDAGDFVSNGLISVKKKDLWGYIDQTGKVVIDFQYSEVGIFANGLARVRKGAKWGYIDQTGKVAIDFLFEDAKNFAPNKLAAVKRIDKWGYIDQTGKTVIENKFDGATDFASNGYASVKKGGKWVFTKQVIPTNEITDYIKTEITKWQQKGKFETTEAYTSRVSKENMKKKLEDLSTLAVQIIAPNYCDWKTIKTEFDADNQTFKVNVKGLSPFYLKVPLSEAEAFDASIGKVQFSNIEYALGSDGKFFIQTATILNPSNDKTYKFSSSDKPVFAYNQYNINFEPLNINLQTSENTSQIKTETKTIVVGSSDVDMNIPTNPQTNDKAFAVIIANENYSREVKVQFAANDGKIFKDYCEKTLGIPTKNIHFAQDATFGTMKSEIKWISDVIGAFNGQAKVIFYYAGHGMPNEADKSAYLLPVDGFSSDYETAIKLDDLYSRLNSSPSQSVTVFLDACFSGSLRDNGMLASARGVKVRPKMDLMKGNMIVFSAATGDETAYPYKEKQHGLFTYFLLKKLQETKGNVDYQTLSNYITEQVKQQSIVVNQKSQTPQVNTSTEVQGSWQMMRIK